MKSSLDLFVGIDLLDAASVLMGDADDDVARRATKLHHLIQRFQESFTSIEKVKYIHVICCNNFFAGKLKHRKCNIYYL